VRKYDQNHRDRLWCVPRKNSIRSVVLPGDHKPTGDAVPRAILLKCSVQGKHRHESLFSGASASARGIKDFPYSSLLESCYSLFRYSTRSRSTAHGMGYPSTRRDRPELRNQLVRQRRALVLSARLCSARFLKRALSISFLVSPARCCTCKHAH
jgi:hypothetical protein